MSTYELDDDLVRAMIEHDWTSAQMDVLTDALQKQLPVPVPTKLAAVVRTSSGAVWLHAHPGSTLPWAHSDGPTELVDWVGTDQLHITEVLFEGVDL